MSEERLDRITAGLAEGRRKDRDEYKSLWRDIQGQIDSIVTGMVELPAKFHT